jgi:hypothetical protein
MSYNKGGYNFFLFVTSMINNPKKIFLRSRRYIDLYYRTLQPNLVYCYDTTLNKM